MYLVDDEPYVIEGIRKCIEWEKHGIEIAGSSTNGLTACEEILAIQPDVVIIDIKMPSMDGISVINKVKMTLPETAELSTIRVRAQELDLPVSSASVHCTFMEVLDHHLMIVYALHHLHDTDIAAVIESIRKNLEIFLTDESDMLRIGISRVERLQNLKAGYYEAKDALAYCQWISADFSSYDAISYGTEEVDLLPLWDELMHAVQSGNSSKASLLLTDQFSAFYEKHIAPKELKEFCLKAYMLIRNPELSFYQIDPILEINSLRSIVDSRSYITNLYRNYFDRLSAEPGGMPKSQFVRQVIDYIHKHYQNPITLYDVAEYMHKSNGYISSRFKKEFGGSFTSYVNDYRLLQSRKLLISGNMKIKEIAVAVGFSDEQYFSNVFKKEFGMTPGNYRKIYRS